MRILPFLLLISVHQSCSLTFTQEPSTKYVFSNKSSSFQCICSGCDGQFWKINGINAEYDINNDKGVSTKGPIVSNGLKRYVLTIPAKDFFNNSNIKCYIYNNSATKTSKTANLYIQGFASIATNISVLQLNSTSLRMSFCPSFALDASVAVDYYIIEITSAMSEGVTKHINTSSTEVTVSLADHCSNYTVSVTPYNSIGQGEKNTKTGIINFQEPDTIGGISIETMVLKTFYGIWMVFKVDPSCLGSIPRQMDASIICVYKMCLSTYLQSCWLNLIDGFSESIGNCSIDFYSTPLNNAIEVKVNLTEYITQGSYYEIHVTLRTSSSPVIPSATSVFNLSTFHTTEAEVTSISLTSVCIKCSLHQDSITTGCLAIFEDIYDKDNVIKLVVNRIPNEVIAYDCFENLQDGLYRVSVTDVKYYSDENFEHIAFVLLDELAIQKLLPVKTSIISNPFSIGPDGSMNFNVDDRSRVDHDVKRNSLMYRLTSIATENISNILIVETTILSSVVVPVDVDMRNMVLSAVMPAAGAGIIIICLFIIVLLVFSITRYHKKAQSSTETDYHSRGVTISYIDNDPGTSNQWSRDYQNSGADVVVRKCVAYETCPMNNPIYAKITDY